MSCKVSKFDICHLKIETWKPYEIAFPADVDISTDKFTYRVYRDKFLKLDKELTPQDGKVIITDPSLDFGKYAHELIWNHNGDIYVVFRGQLEITNYSEFGCSSCTDDSRNIIIDASEKCVNVSVGIIGNTGGSGGGSFSGVFVNNTDKSVTLSGKGLQGTELSAEVKIDNVTLKKKTDGTLYSTATGGGITEVVTGTSGNVKWQGKGTETDALEGNVDLSNLVVKESGKGLSTNDFTTTEKNKLASLSNYNLPTSDATTKGGVKIPTTSSVSISSENIDVKVDGSSIIKNPDGTLSAVGGGGSGGSNVTTYIHSGNKEVVVTSIDYATNTFTSNGHGLANGNRVAFNVSADCDILTQTPFNTGWPVDNTNGGWFVVGVTVNTFQLSDASGGSPISLTQRATNNFSKWKFEVSPSTEINLLNINTESVRAKIVGSIIRNERYVIINDLQNYTGYRNNIRGAVASSPFYSLFGETNINVNIYNGQDLIITQAIKTNINNSALTQTEQKEVFKTDRTAPLSKIQRISLMGLRIFNGTKIIIEKI